jgi:CarD family transcriptional regulator
MAQKKTTSSKKAAGSRAQASARSRPAKRAAVAKKPAKKVPVARPAKKVAAAARPSKKTSAATRAAPPKRAPAKSIASKKAPAKAAPSKGNVKTVAKAPAKKVVAESRRPAAKVEEAPPPVKPASAKPVRPTSRYAVGDKVVHPQHGAATIAKKVKVEFGGVARDYYVLDISTESLTVMVPIDRIDQVVRSVISKTQSKNVLNSLKEEAQEAGANWSRWYKVLTEKMYSGDIFQVAEVVRDLSFAQQTKGISPALKRMLSKARMTLISELSFSLEVDEEEATRRLDKAVPKVESPLVPAV